MLNLPSFAKRPRAIAVDLDGTLFNSQSEISIRSRLAIEKCVGVGVPFIVVTARPERSVRQKLGEDLAAQCTLITMHGVVSRRAAPFRGLKKIILPGETAAEIIKMAQAECPAAHVVVELEGFEYARSQALEMPNLSKPPEDSKTTLLSLEEAVKRNPGVIFIVDFEADLGGFAEKIGRRFEDSLAVIRSNQNHVLSVVKKGVSKKNSLKGLLEEHQVPPVEVIAFGDDLPDVEMLAICGYSVAMANATAEVKAASKYQTLSNDEDGVAVALERMMGDFQSQ